MILVVFAFGILTFYVPRLEGRWAQVDGELGALQRLLVQGSHLAQRTGLFLIASLLFLGFACRVIWQSSRSRS